MKRSIPEAPEGGERQKKKKKKKKKKTPYFKLQTHEDELH